MLYWTFLDLLMDSDSLPGRRRAVPGLRPARRWRPAKVWRADVVTHVIYML